MDYDKLNDDDILRQLEDARMAHTIEHSEEWGIVREAMKRIYEKHVAMLVATDPADKMRVMELQHICKLYSEDFLPNLLARLQMNGQFALEETERRGGFQLFLDKLAAWTGR